MLTAPSAKVMVVAEVIGGGVVTTAVIDTAPDGSSWLLLLLLGVGSGCGAPSLALTLSLWMLLLLSVSPGIGTVEQVVPNSMLAARRV